MMKTGTGLPVLLVDADAESSRACRVNGLPPWVWATYIGWPSERNFPLSVLPFSFPLSFKLFVASITLAESEEELNKEPLYARGEWKSWLQAQLSENKDHDIIPPCQIYGETVATMSDSILGGSKITADGDCSHKVKRRLLLGRKVMTNLSRGG